MKILVINSSFRKNGNTQKILELIEEKLKAIQAEKPGTQIESEIINLNDYLIKPCRGCSTCFRQGVDKCPLRDDFLQIKTAVEAAEVMIWASPVYVGDVNSQMKALIDRFAYLCHHPQLYLKSAYFIATSAGAGHRRALNTMATLAISSGMHFSGKRGFVVFKTDSKEDLRNRYQRPLNKIARKIINSRMNKKYLRPSLFNLVLFRIQQASRTNPHSYPYDIAYWQEQGWAEKQKSYYFPHKASKFKVALAYAMFLVVYGLFIPH